MPDPPPTLGRMSVQTRTGWDLAFLQPLYQRYQGDAALLTRLQKRFGLKASAQQEQATMSGSEMLKLLEYLHAEGDPHVAAWLACCADFSSGNGIAYYLRSHPSVGEMLKELIRQQQRVLPDGILSIQREGSQLILELRPRQQASRLGRLLLMEGKWVWLSRLLSFCLGEDCPPTSACTMTGPSARSAELLAMLQAPVTFNQGAFRLHYPASILSSALPGFSPALMDALKREIDALLPTPRKDLHAATRVIRWLSEQPDLNQISQSKAASALHCGASTLRRHLAEEGTSFADLLQDQRRLRAFDYVALTDEPIHDIASQLGYSDRSAFERAFVIWFGNRPAALRSQLARVLPEVHLRQWALNTAIPRAVPRPDDHPNAQAHLHGEGDGRYASDTDRFIQELMCHAAAPGETQSQMADLEDNGGFNSLRHEWMLVELARAMVQSRDPGLSKIDVQTLGLQSLGALWLHEVRPRRMRIAQQLSQGHDLVYLLQFERDLIGIDRFQAAVLLMSGWVFPPELIARMRTLAHAVITGQPDPVGQALLEADALLRSPAQAPLPEPWNRFISALKGIPLCISSRRRRQRHLTGGVEVPQPPVHS